MATQTVAAIQAALDPQGFDKKIVLIKRFRVGATDTWYATGGIVAPGKAKWVTSTNTDTAAQQATSITTGMTA